MKRSRALWLLGISALGAMLIGAFTSASCFNSGSAPRSAHFVHHPAVQQAQISELTFDHESTSDVAVVETRENREESIQNDHLNRVETDALFARWLTGFVSNVSFEATSTYYIPLLLFFLSIFTLSLPPPAFRRA